MIKERSIPRQLWFERIADSALNFAFWDPLYCFWSSRRFVVYSSHCSTDLPNSFQLVAVCTSSRTTRAPWAMRLLHARVIPVSRGLQDKSLHGHQLTHTYSLWALYNTCWGPASRALLCVITFTRKTIRGCILSCCVLWKEFFQGRFPSWQSARWMLTLERKISYCVTQNVVIQTERSMCTKSY